MRLRRARDTPTAGVDDLPVEVTRRLGLGRRDRPLAAARDDGGVWWVAVHDALFVPDGDDHRRVPWEHVDRAGWDRDTSRFTLDEASSSAAGRRTTTAVFDVSGDLLSVMRERVTATVVQVTPVELPEIGSEVTVTVRRSARDGAVFTQTDLAAGTDPDDPVVAEAVRRAVEQVRSELGV